MSISANLKKILRDYNYLYESLNDVKEISCVAEGEFRQAMIDSGDKEALQALIPNESQQTKLNQIKEEEKCAKLYNNIGVVYQSQSADFKALEYFIKTQKIQEKLKDANIGITYTNIGNGYLKQNNLPK